MGGYGGFYKGEKKKPKKDQQAKTAYGDTPVFTMPEIISKKKPTS
jgi:hypothetical protein